MATPRKLSTKTLSNYRMAAPLVLLAFGCSGAEPSNASNSNGGTASGGGSINGNSSGGISGTGGPGVGGTTAGTGGVSTGGYVSTVASAGGQSSAPGGAATGGRSSSVATGGTAVATGGTAGTAGASAIMNCTAGASCLIAGVTCVNSSNVTCLCVGPAGGSYLTCDTAGTGGATSTGGAGNTGASPTTTGGAASLGGSRATGGSSSTGGTSANGGASSTGGVPGQTCSGTAPYTTGDGDYQITVDAGQRGPTWNRFYEKGVALDHANIILSTAFGRNIQNAMRKGHDQAGFQYIRFHGILNNDIGLYSEDASGNSVYNWTRFDQVYDAIAGAGLRPVVEISFMPPALASGTNTLHWYNGVPANITPPKDWTKWQNLMAAIVQHLEGRYGVDEIRNNWFFEVWNEASWMYTLGDAGYNQLYSYTVKGLLNQRS